MNPKCPFHPDGDNVPSAFPSSDEVERHIARSRQLRAEATAAMLRSAGQTLTRTLHHLRIPPIRRWTTRTAPHS